MFNFDNLELGIPGMEVTKLPTKLLKINPTTWEVEVIKWNVHYVNKA